MSIAAKTPFIVAFVDGERNNITIRVKTKTVADVREKISQKANIQQSNIKLHTLDSNNEAKDIVTDSDVEDLEPNTKIFVKNGVKTKKKAKKIIKTKRLLQK